MKLKKMRKKFEFGCCCSVARSCLTAAHQASLSLTISQSLLKIIFNESVMPSSHLILCCPLLLLPSIFPSMRVFPNESGLHIRWPEYWSFSISERIPKGKKSTAIGQVLVTLHNNLIEISELFCRSWGPHQRADD